MLSSGSQDMLKMAVECEQLSGLPLQVSCVAC